MLVTKSMRRLILLAAAAMAWAQQQPAFEVASVKLNAAGGPASTVRPRSGGMEWENYSLRQFIQAAYAVKDYAFSGPSWLDSVRLDVIAKLPAGARFDQVPAMMQSLLLERFKLAVHREEKEMPALALVVDKKGPRIQPVEPGPGGKSWGSSMVQGIKISMADFADLLSRALERPVKDLTGLPGVYDIKIAWLPDNATSADAPGNKDLAASVYAAVQDQLGLKLQAQRLPVEILVVDHAERVPAGN
jgi:uncharacterized protein (TIGR03435 family)